jgi:hypothetical protein
MTNRLLGMFLKNTLQALTYCNWLVNAQML